MKNIKIKISSLVDGSPWLFLGEGTKTEKDGVICLRATETIEKTKVYHKIEILEDCVKISRKAEGETHLEFFKDKKGTIKIQTEYGNFSGNTITKLFAQKITPIKSHVSLSYNTSFDSENADVKKVQISYWEE